jgi:hypothetical protein
MTYRRAWALLPLSAYVLFLLDITLLEFPANRPRANFVPMRSMIADWTGGGRGLLVNFLGNLVAFMPVGTIPSLAMARRARAWHAALLCLGLSTAIEVGQYASGRRVADVDDVVLNTLGGLLGYLALQGLRGWGVAWPGGDAPRTPSAAAEANRAPPARIDNARPTEGPAVGPGTVED